jgi:hypothetical protein
VPPPSSVGEVAAKAGLSAPYLVMADLGHRAVADSRGGVPLHSRAPSLCMLLVLEALLPLREVVLECDPERRRRPLAGDVLALACAPADLKSSVPGVRRRYQQEGTKATVLAPRRCQDGYLSCHLP